MNYVEPNEVKNFRWNASFTAGARLFRIDWLSHDLVISPLWRRGRATPLTSLTSLLLLLLLHISRD